MRKLLTFLSVLASMYSYSQAMCAGQSATITAGNPQNLTNPQYSLNPGGFSPINGTNQFQISPLVTTAYTIYTTGTNTNNAVQTTSSVLTVTVFPQPVTTPTLIQANCTSTAIGFNLGLTFIPAAPVPGYTITWSSIPNGVLSGQQTSVATGVAPGAYQYTIIAQGGCGVINTITLTPPPSPAQFSLTPNSSVFSLTCIQPSIDVSASEPSYGYTWTSTSTLPQNTQSINLTGINTGTWAVTGQNPGSFCTKTITFTVVQNTVMPSSTVTPLTQNITCTLSSAQTVSVFSNPTVNIGHYIYDPNGGTFAANSHTAIYTVGYPGTYTHCLVNLENGCQVCKNFTVTSSQSFPTFSLQSPDNYTLGCNSKSVATINFVNADGVPSGSPVSYTIIGPPTSTTIPIGPPLSGQSSYTLNVPGTYTAIVRQNNNGCDARSQFSLLQNTAPPSIAAIVPLDLLDCDHTVTVLQGVTETPNVSFNWGFTGTPGNVPFSTVQVIAQLSQPTKTLINTYTLTITDNSSTCRSQTIIPIRQNAYLPKVGFSMGTASITCATPTAVLTNTSVSGIPAGVYPITQPVVGWLWQGPTPQEPLQLSTTYVAGIAGIYTLTGKDLNNGCFAVATQSVDDFRDYPNIYNSSPNSKTVTVVNGTVTTQEVQVPLDCGAQATTLSVSINPPGNKYSYLWQAPIGTSVGVNGKPEYSVGTVGVYTIVVTNTINSCSSFTTMHVIAGQLTASVAVDRPFGFVPHTATFYNNSTSSTGNSSITGVWSFGNGQFTVTPSASITPTTVYTAPGTYSISLNVKKGTCLATTTTQIVVELAAKLEIPNTFSPNGDGINDIYFLNTAQMAEITCIIHDRWGHLVYELSSGTGNVAWDGKNQAGVELSEGVYFYVITATGKDGQTFDEKGTITLFR